MVTVDNIKLLDVIVLVSTVGERELFIENNTLFNADAAVADEDCGVDEFCIETNKLLDVAVAISVVGGEL